jgi:hypothetical protein
LADAENKLDFNRKSEIVKAFDLLIDKEERTLEMQNIGDFSSKIDDCNRKMEGEKSLDFENNAVVAETRKLREGKNNFDMTRRESEKSPER